MNEQPEALRLAECLEEPDRCTILQMRQAASELRRLHEVNAELVEALRQLIDDIDSEAFLFEGGCGVSEVSREKALAAIAKAAGEQQ